jgi:hypothetical protein
MCRYGISEPAAAPTRYTPAWGGRDERTYASVAWTQKWKETRRERFLGEMNAVIPWQGLIALIKPHYPKAG